MSPIPDPLEGITACSPGAGLLARSGRAVVMLAGTENPWGPSEAVQARLRAATGGAEPEPIHRQSISCDRSLREAIAARRGVEPGQVILGNGSLEILELAATVALQDGGSVVLPRFSFAPGSRAAEAAGGQVIEAVATPVEVDIGALLRAVRPDTRLVYLANVNNPTGVRAGREEISHLIRRLREDVLLVVDQAYAEYEEPGLFPDAALHLHERERLLVLHTFSKIHALAGLRVGYGLGCPRLVSRLEHLRGPFRSSPLALVAAEAALQDGTFVALCRERNREARRAFLLEAEQHRCIVSGEGGNFLLMETLFPSMAFGKDLLGRGVLVSPLRDDRLPHHVRISLGRPEEMAAFWRAAAPLLDGVGCSRCC